MSIFLVGDEAESARDLFYKRSAYTLITQAPQNSPVTDFYIAEKQLYGKVDFDYIPILLKKHSDAALFTHQRSLSTQYTSNPIEPPVLPVYVADAFEGLGRAFEKASFTGQVPSGHQYLSTIKVYAAYSDFRLRYDEYLRNYIQAIAGEIRQMQLPVENITQLVEYYEIMLMPALSKENPLTLSSFIKGTQCSRLHTGLALEIADLGVGNDQEKVKHFFNAPAWEFYVNAARAHGFMIDRHVPWRLVADIGSQSMLQYATKYGLNTTGKILDMGYEKAYHQGFIKFINFFLRLYENTVRPTVDFQRLCPDGKIRYVSRPTKKYNFIDVLTEISEERLLRLYFQVRMNEEDHSFTDSQQHILINECMGLFEISRHRDTALEVFARISNKTFDYDGSLSYIVKVRKQMQAETLSGVGGAMSSDTGGGGY